MTGLRRYRTAAVRRLARVGTRLTLAFLAVALLIPVVGVIAIRELHATSMRAAQIEAQHVAEQIAFTMAQREEPIRITPLYEQPDALQLYVDSLRRELGRDIEVVGLDRVIIADAIERNRGQVFNEDPEGQVGATMRDGQPRTFEERNADFPEGIQLVVVPLYSPEHVIVGAVILEYTPIFNELLAASGRTRNIIIAISAGGAVAALLLSYLLARGFVRDLHTLSRAAGRLAGGDDTARARVQSHSEVGDLAAGFNTMAEQIAEQKAVLVEMTASDPLTGLRNRRSFQARLEDLLAEARHDGAPLAMLMLDLDHFKTINDRHGHPAGDAVLQAVAGLLETTLRPEDVAARLGGEEFGVLLP
ncbi:GGDEF domain-containing protein, partial [Asanoa iriomotensis]